MLSCLLPLELEAQQTECVSHVTDNVFTSSMFTISTTPPLMMSLDKQHDSVSIETVSSTMILTNTPNSPAAGNQASVLSAVIAVIVVVILLITALIILMVVLIYYKRTKTFKKRCVPYYLQYHDNSGKDSNNEVSSSAGNQHDNICPSTGQGVPPVTGEMDHEADKHQHESLSLPDVFQDPTYSVPDAEVSMPLKYTKSPEEQGEAKSDSTSTNQKSHTDEQQLAARPHDVYAVVNKTKKKEKTCSDEKLPSSLPQDIYAVVDKTKKKRKTGDGELQGAVVPMSHVTTESGDTYAVVQKPQKKGRAKKPKNKKCPPQPPPYQGEGPPPQLHTPCAEQ